MSDGKDILASRDSLESGLRLHLARGDAVIGSAAPVLRHLLLHQDSALFGDDVLARLRAMLADLARQLAGSREAGEQATGLALLEVPGLVAHLHALALEWAMTLRLQERLGVDPVLSPLMQALIGSSQSEVAARAMQALAAQARFAQNARRMQLPLAELPAELLHAVLATLPEGGAGKAELRAQYDEGATRIGLLAQVVSGMGAGAMAALALGHAGVALFAAALAQVGDDSRDHALLAMQDGQQARLALALRAGGLKVATITENLLALHPFASVPDGLARLGAERAGELLAEMALPTEGAA
jgi:hypothetical protein